MIHSRNLRTSFALLLVALLAACGGPARNSQDLHGARLPHAIARPDFQLTDTDGRPFNFAKDTKGTLTLLAFGYTHCPDVCPVQMANIAAAMRRLSRTEQQRIRVVFVTTDPPRDSAQRLRTWLDSFNPAFVGLRGTEAQIETAEHAVGVAIATREASAPGDTNYTVGHAAQVYAFTPDDSAHRAYPFGTLQQDWAHDLPELLRGAH
ncbi:MAG: SCO family protein [Gemmatimonadaceae bacterium]|nr:SCO family protein [Gemmatimonadaceae bacterium]